MPSVKDRDIGWGTYSEEVPQPWSLSGIVKGLAHGTGGGVGGRAERERERERERVDLSGHVPNESQA